MSLRRYWVAECSFGVAGVRCEAQTLLDAKLPQAEANQTLERIGWRWAGKQLACPSCAAEQQRAAGINLQASIHPDAETIGCFIEGTLDSSARSEIIKHVADCAECRIIVVDVAEMETKC